MLLVCRARGSESWSPTLPPQLGIPDQGGERGFEDRRQEECARKGWLEARFQCYLWKAFPHGDAGELAEEKEAREDATGEEWP